MNNILFDKKFLGESQRDYLLGLDKAWKNFQLVRQEETKHIKTNKQVIKTAKRA